MARKARAGAKERILEYVTVYTDEHGYSPTYREVSDAVGFKSCSTARRYIALLEGEGRLELRNQRTRTMKPLRRLVVNPASGTTQHRVRLEMADGGAVCFDCVLDKGTTIPVGMTFTGVLDATQLKSRIGLLVSCSVDEEV